MCWCNASRSSTSIRPCSSSPLVVRSSEHSLRILSSIRGIGRLGVDVQQRPDRLTGRSQSAQYSTTPTLLGKTIKSSSQPPCPIRSSLYPAPLRYLCVRTPAADADPWQNPRVPLHTEGRILTLCAGAIAAKDESEVERIIVELRAALTEHIRYAKATLEAQAAAIAAIRRPSQITPTEEH